MLTLAYEDRGIRVTSKTATKLLLNFEEKNGVSVLNIVSFHLDTKDERVSNEILALLKKRSEEFGVSQIFVDGYITRQAKEFYMRNGFELDKGNKDGLVYYI